MGRNGLKKVIKIAGITLGVIVVLFIALGIWAASSSGDREESKSEKAAKAGKSQEKPFLEGENLDHFLNRTFTFGSVSDFDEREGLNDRDINQHTVREVFYSEKQSPEYRISPIGTEKSSSGHYYGVLFITENDNPVEEFTAKVYMDYETGLACISKIIDQKKTIPENEWWDYMATIYPAWLFNEEVVAFRTERAALWEQRDKEMKALGKLNSAAQYAAQYKADNTPLYISGNPAKIALPMNDYVVGYDIGQNRPNEWVLYKAPFLMMKVTGDKALLDKYENTAGASKGALVKGDRFILLIQRKGRFTDSRDYNLNDLAVDNKKGLVAFMKRVNADYTIQIDRVLSYAEIMGDIPDTTKEKILRDTVEHEWVGSADVADRLWRLYANGGYLAVKKFADDYVALGYQKAIENAGLKE